jgi:hypothetical protein
MLRRTLFLSTHMFLRSHTAKIAQMSTFTLPGTGVSVKLVDELTQDQLLEFPAFKVPSPWQPYPKNI